MGVLFREEGTSSSLSFSQLPAALCAARSLEPFLAGLSWPLVSPLFSSHSDGHVGETRQTEVSDNTSRHNLIAKTLIFRLLQSSCPLFCNVPRASGVRVFCRRSHWDWVAVGFSTPGVLAYPQGAFQLCVVLSAAFYKAPLHHMS